MMKSMIFSILLYSLIQENGLSQSLQKPPDSTAGVVKKKYNLKLNTRIHSLGFFNFSGRICTDNPAFDFTLTYDRRSWSVMTFSAMDIYDQHSDNNFSLTLLYTRIKVGNRVTVTPYSGFALEDWAREIGDRQIVTTAIKVNPRLHVDHTMMFPNLFGHHDHDWVNRFRMLYNIDSHVDLTFSVWHNNHVLDDTDYLSSGLNAAYSRIKINDQLMLNTAVTVLVMANSSNEEIFPKKNGIVLTIGAVID